MTLTANGDVQVLNGSGGVVWSLGTGGTTTGNYRFQINPDRQVVLLDVDAKQAIWNSRTSLGFRAKGYDDVQVFCADCKSKNDCC